MAEAAGAIILSNRQMFTSDVQGPRDRPDKAAEAFYHTLYSFTFDAKKHPITSLSDKFNAMLQWATAKETGTMTEEQAIARNFILRELEPLNTLADIFMVNDVRPNTVLSREQREYVAEMNQRFARGFYAATDSNAPTELRENAELFIQLLNSLKQENSALGNVGKVHIAGAIAHAKAMHIFNNHFHLVYLPDINDLKEVATWELNAGDMAIWTKGNRNILKVDVKGGIMIAPEVTVTDTGDSKVDTAILTSLIPLIRRDLGDTIKRFPVPTHILSVRLGIPVDLKNNPLGKIDPQMANTIQDQIDRL